jgi:hypothetical protein
LLREGGMRVPHLACVVIVVGCGGGSDLAGDVDAPVPAIDAPPGSPDASTVVVLPTGTISGVTYATACAAPAGAEPIGAGTPGFSCASLTVSCPGLDDATVQVALAPAGDATVSKGAIVTHGGGGGVGFLGNEVVRGIYARGWDLAQIAWDAPWECPLHDGRVCAPDPTPVAERRGIKDAACRGATVMKWIRDEAERRDGSPFVAAGAPMCGEGSSGGSGALWYALVHYGASAWFDFVQVSASTPFARIDIGCDPANAAATVPAACDNVAPPEVPVTYDANGADSDQALNTWFSTTSCDVAPTTDELAMFARNSIVSPGADLDFATPASAYVCVDAETVNIVPGMGHFLADALRANDPAGDRFAHQCVVDGTNGACRGEGVFGDPVMALAAIDELDTRCVPLAP